MPDTVSVTGGQIAGISANGVRVFKGIPFAAPPVADLRWRPPQPGSRAALEQMIPGAASAAAAADVAVRRPV